MVRGNILSSNKSVLANEGAITETGGGLNYARNYHETYKNMQTVTDLFDNGVVEEVVLDTLEWAKPLNFQESYEKITPSDRDQIAHIYQVELSLNLILYFQEGSIPELQILNLFYQWDFKTPMEKNQPSWVVTSK